ncbi:phosphotransferase family protein [Herpetosiphon giganteus]|uniref:phosphotransferase family protein n=1 Tax=Herpetosiphon giganteus TaxID=2029754 RepID=UPI00195D0156|nr:phosphotransferase family protein [Herpetosiphon giganteus]MBM7846341.1 aminoglycoside phosphotransferase (APT) family kinase protein [Herpetosiphon giganteus]
MDTIQVRPDEQLNESALADYLYDKLPGASQALTVRQFGGGAANLTYLLDYGHYEYVLRRPPLGPVAPSAHDMGREYRVLSQLHPAFAQAPQTFLFCNEPEIIGAPFFIMERRHGTVVRRELPLQFNTPEAPRALSLALVDTLADLHAVDYAAIGLGHIGKPDGFILRQVVGWYERWNNAKSDDLPAMENVYAWLCEQQPPASSPTLVHNDYKLDNVMFRQNDPSQLIAVFDWDMCTLGEPLADLGTLLCYWSQPDDPPALQAVAMMPTDERFASRAELIARYAERSGRDVSHIRYYHVLGLYRLVVILAQIYARYQRGQTKDARFAQFGAVIPIMAQAAADLTK